jgi:coenzyme F420-reducing hydrogenase alpha subunit
LDGDIVNSTGKRIQSKDFLNFLEKVVIPYSQSEGYTLSETHKDFLVGALARVNFNSNLLNPKTKADIKQYLTVFPSTNIHHNNLAQAIEILQCVDDALDILKTIKIDPLEKPVRKAAQAGMGVGVVEAPRGILYHMVKVNEKGMVEDCDVIVPTAQNQITIENDLKKFFTEHLDQDENALHLAAEKIVRAYDPCMSCATNFLKIEWIKT